MRRTLFCILILHIQVLGLHAQEGSIPEGFGIESNILGGKVFKHTPKFRPPIPAFTQCAELNLVWQTYGKKEWHQQRGYPVLGLGFTYTDYGMDAVYGRCYGMYPNLQVPVITGKRLEWTFRVGMGIGYITRQYQRTAPVDILNNAIGSHVNNFTLFITDLRYRVNMHWDIQAGLNFTHVSNASFFQPNLGVNMYGAHVGVRYFPVTSQPQKLAQKEDALKNRWLVQARLGMAITGYTAPQGPEFPVYLASAYVSRRYAGKNKMFAGIDYSYHESIYAFLRNNEILPGKEAQNSWKSAVFAGNEFLMGRTGLVLQVGYYLKQAYLKADAPYYEKFGLNYYLLQKEKGPLKELCLAGMIKAHQTVAELFEFGVGVGF
jgi:hypothetical protein